MYERIIRPLLFRLSAETAHHFTLQSLQTASSFIPKQLASMYQFEDPALATTVAGLTFKNPVGLAAGMDKDAVCADGFAHLGFGFLEVGTVTPLPQEGNSRPRLFRLPKDNAIINRMGFNNGGMNKMAENLKKFRHEGTIIGVNIGKNKLTPNEEADQDYELCFHAVHPHCDYIAINISSPNTPELRALQAKKPLLKLLSHMQAINRSKASPVPIFVKIAPDLEHHEIHEIVAAVEETQMAGIIATNTTIHRTGLKTSATKVENIGAGGLSGAPLRHRSTEVVRFIRHIASPSTAIIGVGGIMEPQHAMEKMEAGANLVQLYSGLIYKGPSLVKDIKTALLHHPENNINIASH